jgi:hypothetical protein
MTTIQTLTHQLGVALLVAGLAGQAAAQPDVAVLGNWRGTLKSGQTTESPFVLTIVKKGDGYAGSMSGLGGTSEIPLRSVTVTDDRVRVESADDSKLGRVSLTGELTVVKNTMKGAGTLAVGAQHFDVAFDLVRRARQDVVQPLVEQRIDYFSGRWTFEYTGGEFPPLSAGGRGGTVTFSREGRSNFVTALVEGEALGRKYQETVSIGFDPATNMVIYVERRQDGTELASLGNWQSPLAINFTTSPLQAAGKTYQMRRTIAVLSDTAFDVTEEFSIDNGAFRRLGNAHYTKQ